jgi:hypothetical protein
MYFAMAISKLATMASPILVTGMHRGGTTWVGKMLAAAAGTAYISEPLNILHRPGVFHTEVKYWYQYICDDNEHEFLPAYEDLLEFDYHLWDEIRSLRSKRDVLRMGRDFYIFYNGLMRGQRPLWKDPFAVFSTPWFARRLNCKIVITVRHPAACVSSLQRLQWSFDFENLLDQPLLMRDHLGPYREAMLSMQKDDIVGQAALLWKMIYRTVQLIREQHPDFLIVRHEDLSLDPIPGFRSLYTSLGLEFTPRVEKIIRNSSSAENPGELSRRKVHAVKVNSRANVNNWKRRLTTEEIERIRKMTDDIAKLYYSDAEW